MRSSLLPHRVSNALPSRSFHAFLHTLAPSECRNTLRHSHSPRSAVQLVSRSTLRPAHARISMRRPYTQEARSKDDDTREKQHSDNLVLPVAFPGSPGGQGGSGGGGLFSITRSPLFDAALTTFIGLGMGKSISSDCTSLVDFYTLLKSVCWWCRVHFLVQVERAEEGAVLRFKCLFKDPWLILSTRWKKPSNLATILP